MGGKESGVGQDQGEREEGERGRKRGEEGRRRERENALDVEGIFMKSGMINLHITVQCLNFPRIVFTPRCQHKSNKEGRPSFISCSNNGTASAWLLRYSLVLINNHISLKIHLPYSTLRPSLD